jgi:hypothetical protein
VRVLHAARSSPNLKSFLTKGVSPSGPWWKKFHSKKKHEAYETLTELVAQWFPTILSTLKNVLTIQTVSLFLPDDEKDAYLLSSNNVHEIRNLLTFIKTFAQLAADQTSASEFTPQWHGCHG